VFGTHQTYRSAAAGCSALGLRPGQWGAPGILRAPGLLVSTLQGPSYDFHPWIPHFHVGNLFKLTSMRCLSSALLVLIQASTSAIVASSAPSLRVSGSSERSLMAFMIFRSITFCASSVDSLNIVFFSSGDRMKQRVPVDVCIE
jgi:hypothetical protein